MPFSGIFKVTPDESALSIFAPKFLIPSEIGKAEANFGVIDSISIPAIAFVVEESTAIYGAITNETIDINLIKMFIEGPEVSLNGSPTVSPVTAAL